MTDLLQRSARRAVLPCERPPGPPRPTCSMTRSAMVQGPGRSLLPAEGGRLRRSAGPGPAPPPAPSPWPPGAARPEGVTAWTPDGGPSCPGRTRRTRPAARDPVGTKSGMEAIPSPPPSGRRRGGPCGPPGRGPSMPAKERAPTEGDARTRSPPANLAVPARRAAFMPTWQDHRSRQAELVRGAVHRVPREAARVRGHVEDPAVAAHGVEHLVAVADGPRRPA